MKDETGTAEKPKRRYTRRVAKDKEITKEITPNPTNELEWLRGYRQAVLDTHGSGKNKAPN